MSENLDIWDFHLEEEEVQRISGLNNNVRRFGDYTRFA